MTHSVSSTLRGAFPLCVAALAAARSAPAQSVQLGVPAGTGVDTTAETPSPPRFTVTPAIIPSDGAALVRISDPGADSITIESVNGLDRYAKRGNALAVRLTGHFGELRDSVRYAVRERGVLFDIVKRPVKVTTCRQRRCVDYYHTLTIRLPERNERSVALTAGWATAFTRRSITGQNKSVLLREALNNSVWSMQAELATRGVNARLQGYYNTGEQGGSLDLSHNFKPPVDDAMAYGIAMHLSTRRLDWLENGTGTGVGSRSAYQASIGPSVMLKGVTASSQIGFYTDGRETLQLLSTVISVNGNLTEIRSPVSLSLEKTFAFGSGAILPRRRDGTERMMVGLQLTPAVALRLGIHSRRSSWPIDGSTGDIQASEIYYSLGAQYSLTW
jgi:hypothetical protein